MRLTNHETKSIISSVNKISANHKVTLYLYGSRIDDSLKGGDIDLLLVCQSPQAKLTLTKKKIDLLVEIKTLIGEQRIDLSIITAEQAATQPFWQNIKKIQLYSNHN